MTKQRQPKIRFKGFSGDWEIKVLGDISTTFSGGTPNVENIKYYGGLIPFIRSGEISSNKTELFLTEDGLANSSAKMVEKGDILYALYGATSGEVSRSKISGAINQAILAIIPISLINFDFIAQWLKKYKAQIVSTYLQGGQGNLSASIIKKLILDIPQLIEEQTQIGNFFQQIDKAIALHEQKHTQTLNLKKAMLEKMFPKAGCKQPEIRFNGFSGDWDFKILGDIGEFNPSACIPEDFEYVDLESVVGTELISSRKENKKTAPSRAQRLARYGDVFYQAVRPYQKNNYLFNLPFHDYVFSTGYIQIRPNIDSYFLLSCIQENNFVKKILDSCTGTNYPAINTSNLMNIDFFIPIEREEQTQIGNYFKQLDDTIALQAQQLKKLKNIKQAFLENMFV